MANPKIAEQQAQAEKSQFISDADLIYKPQIIQILFKVMTIIQGRTKAVIADFEDKNDFVKYIFNIMTEKDGAKAQIEFNNHGMAINRLIKVEGEIIYAFNIAKVKEELFPELSADKNQDKKEIEKIMYDYLPRLLHMITAKASILGATYDIGTEIDEVLNSETVSDISWSELFENIQIRKNNTHELFTFLYQLSDQIKMKHMKKLLHFTINYQVNNYNKEVFNVFINNLIDLAQETDFDYKEVKTGQNILMQSIFNSSLENLLILKIINKVATHAVESMDNEKNTAIMLMTSPANRHLSTAVLIAMFNKTPLATIKHKNKYHDTVFNISMRYQTSPKFIAYIALRLIDDDPEFNPRIGLSNSGVMRLNKWLQRHSQTYQNPNI